jgi:hypothetical protein
MGEYRAFVVGAERPTFAKWTHKTIRTLWRKANRST